MLWRLCFCSLLWRLGQGPGEHPPGSSSGYATLALGHGHVKLQDATHLKKLNQLRHMGY
jgi:hypothetical protein